MKILKQTKIAILALALLVSSLQASNFDFNTYNDPEKDRVIIFVLKNILTRGHYVVKNMNDDFSEMVYDGFITSLDPNKRYFTQKDLKEFSQYKYQIDNQLKNDDITFYKLVYNRFLEKIKNAKSNYSQILDNEFNFNKKEEIDIDYEKVPFAKNENELIDYWRKQLKLQTLGRIQQKINLQEEKSKNKKNFKKKSFKELEKEARDEVHKNMDELYMRIEELEHQDWFSTFLNSVVGAFDPHTTYMDPSIKEKFDKQIEFLNKVEYNYKIIRMFGGIKKLAMCPILKWDKKFEGPTGYIV